MISVGLEPQRYITRHLLFTTIGHLLIVGNLAQLSRPNLFLYLAYAINIRHISIYKMISVGLEPQWYITQRAVFTTRPLARSRKSSATYSPIPFFTRPLARCWKPSATYTPINLLSRACAINIRRISSHKMIFVELEPQWYITQRVGFNTRLLARCWKLSATYSHKSFSLACAINIGYISSYKMISVALEHYTACILYN